MMNISIKKTHEMEDKEWNSYISSFNTVFSKHFTLVDFRHKYLKTIDDDSYHSLFYINERIVGAFTIIPYEYFFDNIKIRLGLAVDVFILEEHRKNPISLLTMYKTLKMKLIDMDIDIVAGVPNDMAYPFWIKVLKWKDIGCIPYYALPVKAGNIISKSRFILNSLNTFFLKIWLMNFTNPDRQANTFPIHINKDISVIEEQRYTDVHQKVTYDGSFLSYRVVDEDGIITCYLIDFYNVVNKQKNKSSLRKAIHYIINSENIDVIIYVGTLSFKPGFLIKVPFTKEPKHLYFTCDIINKKINEDLVFDIKNWDFGLFNYDVR